MTRSPDSLIPSVAGQPATEKRDDKAFKCRQEGEANLWAATAVYVVWASSPPAIRPIQLELIPGRACLCKAKPATDRKPARGSPDRRDGVERGSALNTRPRTRAFRPLSLTTSTRHPSKASNSSWRPPRSNRDLAGSISTRESMSLASSASPRATEPKTRTLRSPYLAAIRIISSSCFQVG